MEDKELFELCKQVHRATNWSEPGQKGFMNSHGLIGRPWQFPLYTSDYLFTKLPPQCSTNRMYTSGAEAVYMQKQPWVRVTSDTPLKSLLKLTLALHSAGEIK